MKNEVIVYPNGYIKVILDGNLIAEYKVNRLQRIHAVAAQIWRGFFHGVEIIADERYEGTYISAYPYSPMQKFANGKNAAHFEKSQYASQQELQDAIAVYAEGLYLSTVNLITIKNQ